MNELEKKILWQCRRGLWELDAILIPFLQNNFATLSDEEIQLFRKLLAYEDIEIFDILVNKKPFDDKSLENIINQIIDHHELSLGGGV
ncbi:MAG: succinate dehydrogenase assembly factor 2 [SAR86 cluster bacterium]|nr:succinate dehydrogenase assembly factor 2 [SAR86 cluster bacterium]